MAPLRSVPWDSTTEAAALAFLNNRFATSMFLLSNRESFGTTLGEHPSSGNFRVLLRDGNVEGVFSLTRRGNLLVSGDVAADTLAAIAGACAREGIPLQGVLGNWELAEHLWQGFALPTCSFRSKEILYQLDPLPSFPADPAVRFLVPSDFTEWRPMRHAYQAEEGLTRELPEDQLRANFERFCGMNEYWGLFEGGKMVSTAALNARTREIGQVGGVFTWPEHRGKGYSQRTMRQLLRDCAVVHGLRRMILFTGEANFAAQRVYEKLGFRKIGNFGIFFV
jgi:predicted GNAT family acetyltransferase